jgi:Uri superfamily endonuclease
MKGTYVLIISMPKSMRITVGKLGTIYFKRGYYTYVGSAFGSGGLEARVGRHLSSSKKIHWHIDYLLQKSKVIEVVSTSKKCESYVANRLGKLGEPVVGFGSTDTGDVSHLIYFRRNPSKIVFNVVPTQDKKIFYTFANNKKRERR